VLMGARVREYASQSTRMSLSPHGISSAAGTAVPIPIALVVNLLKNAISYPAFVTLPARGGGWQRRRVYTRVHGVYTPVYTRVHGRVQLYPPRSCDHATTAVTAGTRL
jgi:hypothetical protein